jgi:HEPN domain-containing protein
LAEKFWFERAREFLRVAEEVKATYPWLSCFSSQQGVEFVLKGLLVKYKGSHPFTHDLTELIQVLSEELKVEVPEEVLKECDYLTPHYIQTRYSMLSSYDRRRAERCLASAKAVLTWLGSKFQEVKEVVS